MKGVAVISPKGGVGKTCLSHALALGSVLKGTPAHMMHTDNRPPIKVLARPYMYYDARNPSALETLVSSALNQDGLCVIDSGGNRPEIDQWIAPSVDLVVMPINPDEEAVDETLRYMEVLKGYGADNIALLLNMVSGNKNERLYDFQQYFSRLPQDQIIGNVAKVAAIKRLKQNDHEAFKTPPTNVNSLSRKLYFTVMDALNNIEATAQESAAA